MEYERDLKPKFPAYVDSFQHAALKINEIVQANNYDERTNLAIIQVDIEKTYYSQMNSLTAGRSRILLAKEEVKSFTAEYLEKIAIHDEYVKSMGFDSFLFDTAPMIDKLDTIDQSLIEMSQLINQHYASINKRIEISNTALIEQFVNNKTLKMIEESSHLISSTEFLNKINISVQKAFVDTKSKTYNGVPLFSDRYVAINEFLGNATICTTEIKAEWTFSGCSFANDRIETAKKALSQIPSNMKLVLNIMESKGQNRSVQINRIKSLLISGEIGQATTLYDSLAKEIF